jgi:hypothetical protein
MSLEIFVDVYSGYRANERPQRFTVDEEVYEIASIEEQWRSPEGMFFKVRSTEGKQYLLRYDEHADRWTLQSGLDGDALLARPSIRLISVEPKAIREAESRIAGCEGIQRALSSRTSTTRGPRNNSATLLVTGRKPIVEKRTTSLALTRNSPSPVDLAHFPGMAVTMTFRMGSPADPTT